MAGRHTTSVGDPMRGRHHEGQRITRTTLLPVAASVPQAHAGADRARVARFISRARACRRASSLNRRRQREAPMAAGPPQGSAGRSPRRCRNASRRHEGRAGSSARECRAAAGRAAVPQRGTHIGRQRSRTRERCPAGPV